MHTDKCNFPKKQIDNVYLQLPEQNLADITDSKKGFTDLPTSPQSS